MTNIAVPFENDQAFLEETRSYFARDTFVFETIGMEILAAAFDHALVAMPVGPHLDNAKTGVQGGAMYTLADIACAVADYRPGELNMTVDGSIQYLSVSKGSVLYAHAHAMRRGRTLGYYRVDITDDEGADIAGATFTYLHRPA